MTLRTVPVGLAEARRFVGEHHRHNLPPQKLWRFGVGVAKGDALVGVGIVATPTGRKLMDGLTVEVTRVCTTGEPNACSMLYGALARAAFALGYRRLVTYTLASERGTSLKAAGWRVDAEGVADRPWDMPNRVRYATDLFGNDRRPTEAKVRWVKERVA